MKVLSIIFFSVLHYCCADKDGVPVFVIDDDRATSHWIIQSDPFKKVTTSYFGDVVGESRKRTSCIIIFIEENFSTEDIALKDSLGTPYQILRRSIKENKAKYIPSVSQPYKTLIHLFPPKKSNIFYIDRAEKFVLPEKHLKYFYVSFEDAFNATRTESLRNHDAIINNVISKVKALRTGPVVAFYTGKRNPVTIEKIDFSIKYSLGNKETFRSHKALFRLTGVHSVTPLRLVRFTELPEVVAEHWTPNSYTTRMTYTDFELRFSFKFTESEWALNDIVLMEGNEIVGVTRTSSSIRAPWGCSYVCSSPLIVRNNRDGSSVIISSYQLQALRTDDDEDNKGSDTSTNTNGTSKGNGNDTFDNSVNCEPFFSCQILTGLFVSVLLLSILGAGLLGLIDCKTNDKFDDPNGKEILSKADLAQS